MNGDHLDLDEIARDAEGARRLEAERGYRVGVTAMDPETTLALVAEVRQLRAQIDIAADACTVEMSGRSVEGSLADGDSGPWLAHKVLEVLRPSIPATN